MKQEYLKTNQALWDAKTPVHLESDMYDMQAFLAGKNTLDKIELEGVGKVKGKSMLHLQCHFGQDSLCWQRLWSRSNRSDFSAKAIEQARKINQSLELSAKFVQSDIYALPENLDGKFDIIFTSYGTITWLPDLDKWAKVIRHFLKVGGVFYIADFHPSWYAFDFDTKLPA
jgi:ubiquinone/menaquinone biosynthesis C-methylase UbiE